MTRAVGLAGRWSLGTHLTWVVLLAMVPALTIQYAANLARRKEAKVRAQEHLQQLVGQLANQQEQVTASARQMLTTLSLLPELRDPDTRAFSRILEALHQEDPRFGSIFATDREGRLIASAIPAADLSFSDRGYFKKAVETGRFTTGEYNIGRISGIPSLPFALPVLDGRGRVLAVLVAAYQLDAYEGLFGHSEVPSGTSTVVVDQSGTVIYHRSSLVRSHGSMVGSKAPEPQLQRILGPATEGTYWAPRRNGEATLFAFHQIRVADEARPYLCILVGRTEADVLGEALLAHRRNMLLLLFTGVCALVAARAMGNWAIATPIRQLVDASRLIGRGSFSRRPELRTASREVAQLEEELWRTSQALARRDEEQRATEETLRHTQRTESLGVLAGGIAHDFNNLLAAVLGNLNLAQMRLEPDDPTQRPLRQAEKAVQKATELTRQMLAYSGRGHVIVKPLDLNLAVQEMVHLLHVTLPKRTVLRLDLAPELSAILADAAQVQQVVLNLVTNASEAIGTAEGVISLSTRAVRLEAPDLDSLCPNQDLAAGRYAILEVRDTGCGMGPDLIERIFDPFFTTKSKGHGLGLSAMHGILRIHHAGIRIQSQLGAGSTFQVLFPATDEQIAPVPEDHVSPQRRFSGLALVADDEPMVLDFAGAALETMGFDVIRAVDGVEAVERFMTDPERFRLAILDITMPRMDGLETFTELKRRCPALPIILSSGYDPASAAQNFMDLGQAWFLPKPYPIREFRRVVLEAMAQAGPEAVKPPAPPTPEA
jgi:signal transduction histidine kinase/CheY-like chemotaxis protein